jgi:hypothetical protein
VVEYVASILGIEKVWEKPEVFNVLKELESKGDNHVIYNMQRILKLLMQKSEFFDIVLTLGKLENLPFDELIDRAAVMYEFRKLFQLYKKRLEVKKQMIKDKAPQILLNKEETLIRECNDKISDMKARYPYVTLAHQKIEKIERYFPRTGGFNAGN